MGFGGLFGGSDATTKTTTVQADNQATILTGKGANLTESGGVTLNLGKGAAGKFIAPNALDLAGANINSGFSIGEGAQVRDVHITSTGGSEDLLAALTSGQNATQGLFQELIGKVTETVQNAGKADEDNLTGIPQPSQWKLWLALAAGGFGLWLLFRKN